MSDYRRVPILDDMPPAGFVGPESDPTHWVMRSKLQRRVRFYKKRRERRVRWIPWVRDATFHEAPVGWIMYWLFRVWGANRPQRDTLVAMDDETAVVTDWWDEWQDVN